MKIVNRKSIQGFHPGLLQGYFTWIRTKGKEGIDTFNEVYIVTAEGTLVTDEGQFSVTAPIRYCKTPLEAITLVNSLNSILGTKDMSLPYPKCPNCESNKVQQSSKTWENGCLHFECLDCNHNFKLNKNT